MSLIPNALQIKLVSFSIIQKYRNLDKEKHAEVVQKTFLSQIVGEHS